jgi:hypothetical protein
MDINMKRRKFIQLGAVSPLLTLPIAYATKGNVFQKDTIQEPRPTPYLRPSRRAWWIITASMP